MSKFSGLVGRPRGPLTVALALAVWFSLACNGPLWAALWRHLGGRGSSGVAVMAAAVVAVTALQFALLAALAWRPVFKPLAALLVLTAATASAFMLQFGVVIDAGMMTNVWQTDALEVKGILNARWLLTVLALALPPLWWLWRTPLAQAPAGRPWWRGPWLGQALSVLAALALAVLAVLPVYKDASALMRNDKSLRYRITPSNALYATVQSLRPPKTALPLTPMGADARASLPAGARPRLLTLVVGETVRADHFGLNGYERDTTPELRRDGVLNFPNVSACGTSTAVSLPCMFSLQTREAHLAEQRRLENLLDVLQRAGWRVLWLENQSGCKGVCDRVERIDTQPASLPAGLCEGGQCQDVAMLHGLPERVAQAMQAAQAAQAPGVVLLLHQMGSHGPEYFRRSAPALKHFQPECHQADLGACERAHIVNAYDNSIRATSDFLGRALDWLQAEQSRYDTALLYVSDHGESLGENGLYLHGMPWALAPRVQTHVPMLAWFSPAWLRAQPMSAACLQAQAAKAWTHDNYAPSVLGLLSVQTQAYQGDLDIFAPCRGAA